MVGNTSGSGLPRSQRESAAGSANWLEIDRSPHAVHFYSGEGFLLDSLSRFVSTALEAGDSCFVFVTQAHLDGLAARLKARGVNTELAAKEGRYVRMDAFRVLAQFMVDGRLDKTRFDEFIGKFVSPLKATAESKPQRAAVGGELAGLLWAQGKVEAAIELEHFWNDLATQGCYCLRCFYPIASFSDPRQNELFLKICAEHASVITPERSSATGR
jgi:hypothetical protein